MAVARRWLIWGNGMDPLSEEASIRRSLDGKPDEVRGVFFDGYGRMRSEEQRWLMGADGYFVNPLEKTSMLRRGSGAPSWRRWMLKPKGGWRWVTSLSFRGDVDQMKPWKKRKPDEIPSPPRRGGDLFLKEPWRIREGGSSFGIKGGDEGLPLPIERRREKERCAGGFRCRISHFPKGGFLFRELFFKKWLWKWGFQKIVSQGLKSFVFLVTFPNFFGFSCYFSVFFFVFF